MRYIFPDKFKAATESKKVVILSILIIIYLICVSFSNNNIGTINSQKNKTYTNNNNKIYHGE